MVVAEARAQTIVVEPFYAEVELLPATEEPLSDEALRSLDEDSVELYICMDCGARTLEIDEYYMLKDKLWQRIVPQGYWEGVLCIGCFEFYLGRKLRSTDFTEAPVNYLGRKSERLRDRLGAYFTDVGGPFDTPEEAQQAAETLARGRNRDYALQFWGEQEGNENLAPVQSVPPETSPVKETLKGKQETLW